MSTKPGTAKKDPHKRVRKIGEREEVIEELLSDDQVHAMHEEIMVLLTEEEKLEERAKEAAKNFQSQIKTAELQRNELRRTVTSRKRRTTVVVEEHLTAANEVIRIRKDTGDQIGKRTATANELQEPMFPDKPPGDQDDDPAQQSDAQGATPSGQPEPDMAFGETPA
jgi:hypothetical protein